MASIKTVRGWLVVSSTLVLLIGIWNIIFAIILWSNYTDNTPAGNTAPIIQLILGILTILSGLSGLSATRKHNESALSCFACSNVCWFIIYLIVGLILVVQYTEVNNNKVCNGDTCIYRDDKGNYYSFNKSYLTMTAAESVIWLIVAAFFFSNIILSCVISNHPEKHKLAHGHQVANDNYHLHVDSGHLAPHDQHFGGHHGGHHGAYAGHHGGGVHHGGYPSGHHGHIGIQEGVYQPPSNFEPNVAYAQPIPYGQVNQNNNAYIPTQVPVYYNHQGVNYGPQRDSVEQQHMNQQPYNYPYGPAKN